MRNRDDLLSGGSGEDTLFGGDGDDKLVSGLGKDSLNGGNGSDELISLQIDGDIIDGGPGSDFFQVSGEDTVLDKPGVVENEVYAEFP